jgi:glyoxylase-like metal-dependent hydrolase (beta-lactamase superfamily II)
MKQWTIGDVLVTAIIETDLTGILDVVIPEATQAAVKQLRWLIPHFADENGVMSGYIQAFAIRTPTRRVVVDTCLGNDKDRDSVLPAWSRLQTNFLERLSAAGFPPDEVDTVMCTHMHLDHVGWNTRLVDGRWVPTFRNARYLFGRLEFQHWTKAPAQSDSEGGDGMSTEAQAIVNADSVLPIVDAGLATFVETDHKVCEEISLMPSFGHTPGHVSVRIASNGATAIISGDFIHHPCQLAHPEWGSVADSDAAQAMATRRRIFADLAGTRTLFIGAHFGGPTAGWVVRDGAAFRLKV